MESKRVNKDSASRASPRTPAPSKRFRIEKLEERIAPSKGGKGTQNCSSSGGGSSASSGFSGSVSIF